MSPLDRSSLRTAETALALLVLAIVAVMTTNFPVGYPSWPTLAGVPVNPELVVPGLLAIVVLLGVVADGLRVVTVVLGLLAIGTFLPAVVSYYALYTDTASGAFGGGILTLTVAVPLAVVVLLRYAVREAAHHGVKARISS